MELVVTLLSGVVAAFATALFTSRAYVRRARVDLHKEFESRFNERKWEAYRSFAILLKKVLLSSKAGRGQKDNPKLVRDFYEFLPEIWLVASDGVAREFLQWRRTALDERSPSDALVQLFAILVEMRRDLGYEQTSLGPEELLGTFIDDVAYLLKPEPQGA